MDKFSRSFEMIKTVIYESIYSRLGNFVVLLQTMSWQNTFIAIILSISCSDVKRKSIWNFFLSMSQVFKT